MRALRLCCMHAGDCVRVDVSAPSGCGACLSGFVLEAQALADRGPAAAYRKALSNSGCVLLSILCMPSPRRTRMTVRVDPLDGKCTAGDEVHAWKCLMWPAIILAFHCSCIILAGWLWIPGGGLLRRGRRRRAVPRRVQGPC